MVVVTVVAVGRGSLHSQVGVCHPQHERPPRRIRPRRRGFLQQELDAVNARLAAIDVQRSAHDNARSGALRLLGETVALDTFLAVQRDIAKLEADVADLICWLRMPVWLSAPQRVASLPR